MKTTALAVILAITIFSGTAQAGAFDSIYHDGAFVMYKDNAGVYKFLTLYGFKESYNPHDSRVMCMSENECPGTVKTFSLREDSVAREFKIFCPAGSTINYLMFYAYKNSQVGLSMKWDSPPTGSYPTWGSIPVDDDLGIQFDDIGDVTVRNSGHLKAMYIHGKPLAKARWLYVRVHSYDGSMPTSFTWQCKVDVPLYAAAYDKINWMANGDPGGGAPPPPSPPPPPPPPPTDERQKALDALEVARGYILTH